MGKNSRQRREARRRTHPRAAQTDVAALIDLAARLATVSQRVAGPTIDQLLDAGARAQVDPATLVVDEALARIGAAWEHGWQPLDLVHATRRRVSAAGAAWLARAVLVEADRSGAADRAPGPWAEQLQVLTSRHRSASTPLLTSSRPAVVADWVVALVVLDLLRRLPRAELLGPPPSRWGSTTPPPAARSRPGSHDTKTLTKIRALLAKAESTEFSAEAEAFTAKAQDLMTRHAIDEALLSDAAGESVDVHGLRVLIHHPYGVEKATLLAVVAGANRVKAVWNDFASTATLVGVPTDVAQVEMLFTSTLVQATRAMTRAGETSHGADRSSSFRKAFLSAYAVRIGERLAASSHDATVTYGSALVPVLERQAEAVVEEFERLFPHVTSGSRRRSYDARGWQAGTRAADDAVFPAAEVGPEPH